MYSGVPQSHLSNPDRFDRRISPDLAGTFVPGFVRLFVGRPVSDCLLSHTGPAGIWNAPSTGASSLFYPNSLRNPLSNMRNDHSFPHLCAANSSAQPSESRRIPGGVLLRFAPSVEYRGDRSGATYAGPVSGQVGRDPACGSGRGEFAQLGDKAPLKARGPLATAVSERGVRGNVKKSRRNAACSRTERRLPGGI